MSALFIPISGRLTDQNVLAGPLIGGEAMYIVSPGSNTLGNSFQIATATLGSFFYAWPFLNTETITAGATSTGPYMVEPTDTRILFNKTIGSASFAVLPKASTMIYPAGIIFKDIKGDAVTDPITITFSNGELCDGLTQVVIDIAYAWVTINPLVGGGGWYMTS